MYDLYDEDEMSKRPQSQPWTPGINFLESHLRTKKVSSGKPAKINSTLTPVIDLQMRRKFTPTSSTAPTKSILKNTNEQSSSTTRKFYLDPQYDWGYENEYDPAHFCNYYQIHEELELWRENEQRKKALMNRGGNRDDRDCVKSFAVSPPLSNDEKLNKNFLSSYGYDSDDCESDDEKESNASLQRGRGAEFAPPQSLMNFTQNERDFNNPVTCTRSGEDVAAKIMAKYGFKRGHGLGKDEQGMSTALQVERIVRNCGRILHEKDLMPPPVQISQSQTPQMIKIKSIEQQTDSNCLNDLLKNPSKVILLCNMVGSGEVDNELEKEIKDECNLKYGEVVHVIIYERKSDEVADDEAVRVFVEFRRAEAAVKAIVDLNGRYFGGRTVRAQFYNFDKYKAYKLDD